MADYQNMPRQQTFDWTKQSAQLVEGLKFDLGVDYDFVLDNVETKEMVRKDGSKVTRKDGTVVVMNTLQWKETQTNVIFKMDFFVNDKYRVNENDLANEDDIVKLSRKLGYKPKLGGKFALVDFLHLGMKITAKLKELPKKNPNDVNEKVYKTIDIATISTDGSSGPTDLQQSIPEDDISELKELIKGFSKGCKKQPEVYKKIRDSKRDDVDKLIGVAAEMFALKELKL
jgi:hypothetical protein